MPKKRSKIGPKVSVTIRQGGKVLVTFTYDAKALRKLQELGRIGGLKGGKLRWEGVSAEDRRKHAKMAAQARWSKARKK